MNKVATHINFESINSKLIEIRNTKACAERSRSMLLDFDVAKIYGIATKRVNEAVKNNADKFPKGYLFELSNEEFENLQSKFSTTNLSKTRVAPKVFTEKGLYMLATVIARYILNLFQEITWQSYERKQIVNAKKWRIIF